MSEQKRPREHPRTTPSRAVGESGDQEAREAADEAVLGTVGDLGDAASDDADGHSAKRQRPGIGREEQVRPHREREEGPAPGRADH